MLDKYSPKELLASSTDPFVPIIPANPDEMVSNSASAGTDMRTAAHANADRRASERHRAVMRVARLSSCVHQVEGMGVVRNISEGGMLVQSHLHFGIGENVVISLLDGDQIRGEIVWQNGNAFGIEFCSWISVENVLAKSQQANTELRPRAPRLVISQPILLRSGSYLADARICDISQHGAKVQFNKYLAIDCRVQISRGELRPASASVKWQAGNLVGLEFHRTLSIAELSEWTAAA